MNQKFISKLMVVGLTLGVCLTGCVSNKEEVIVETLAPKETDEIITRHESDTKIPKMEFDEASNFEEVIINENGEKLSQEEVEKESLAEQEQIESLIEPSSDSEPSNNEPSDNEPLSNNESSSTDETLSIDEVNEVQDKVAQEIDKITYQDAIDNMRMSCKTEVANLKADYPELAEITDEMIDSMSEDELGALTSKIVKIKRGY